MRIAIIHDDLVQWGGAERVLEAISEIFPDAPIYTSVFDRTNKQLIKRFGSKQIITSFLQKIPFWRKIYKPLMPLYPIAFEQFDFSAFDLVISHTTRFAKSIITKPGTVHVCYCHTPPRFLWNFSGEKTPLLLKPFLKYFRVYDKVTSGRVDYFLAGSKNAEQRIREVYSRESKVVYPFVDLERFSSKGRPACGWDGGYFVVIARLNKYKRVDLAVAACAKLGVPLKVIGTGSEIEKLKRLPLLHQTVRDRNDIQFLGNLSDEMVVKVLSGAKALIVPGIEDFGITPLEAEVLGKPVIAYGAGGTLETVVNDPPSPEASARQGQTGVFFEKQSVDSLVEAIKKLESLKIDPEKCKENAKRFSKGKFMRDFKNEILRLATFAQDEKKN